MPAPKSDPTLASTPDREIITSRLLDAPREVVWKAWTDPDHMPRWWGPAGFSLTTNHFDFKPGGQWRYIMHGPDGRDYPNLVTYLEIAEPERLVYKHGGEKDFEHVNFQTTVTFEKAGASGEKTLVTMRAVFPSADAREFVIREYNAVEGGKQHLARLGEFVSALQGRPGAAPGESGIPMEITRVFKAPRALVWKAWTERDSLALWFGPKGTTIPQCTLDLRPGGLYHYCMRMPDGSEHWARWVFREIIPPEKLVFIVSFADPAANIVRAPFDGDWPREMLSTVTFAEHAGIGRGTVVTLRWTAYNATDTERATFNAGHANMNQGWTGTFDQLEEFLGKAG